MPEDNTPKFNFSGNEDRPWYAKTWVFLALEDGETEDDLLVFVPQRGKKDLPDHKDRQWDEMHTLADFISSAMNEYIKTPEGREKWEKYDECSKRMMEVLQKQ
jgi:hypothetical protein